MRVDSWFWGGGEVLEASRFQRALFLTKNTKKLIKMLNFTSNTPSTIPVIKQIKEEKRLVICLCYVMLSKILSNLFFNISGSVGGGWKHF